MPVIDILKGKHPEARIPVVEHFDAYENEPNSMGIFCYEEDVANQASQLSGATSPSGVDAVPSRSWLVRYGEHSEKLRVEMTKWVVLISNGSPDYAI